MDKAKLVKKLKYLKNEPTLQVDSISPVELLGASVVWVYDTVKRKLGIYRSEYSGGIHVKGTTIIGIKNSEQKTLRKPEKQLPEFLKLRKSSTQIDWFDAVKAKAQPLKGRTNEHMLILKAE